MRQYRIFGSESFLTRLRRCLPPVESSRAERARALARSKNYDFRPSLDKRRRADDPSRPPHPPGLREVDVNVAPSESARSRTRGGCTRYPPGAPVPPNHPPAPGHLPAGAGLHAKTAATKRRLRRPSEARDDASRNGRREQHDNDVRLLDSLCDACDGSGYDNDAPGAKCPTCTGGGHAVSGQERKNLLHRVRRYEKKHHPKPAVRPPARLDVRRQQHSNDIKLLHCRCDACDGSGLDADASGAVCPTCTGGGNKVSGREREKLLHRVKRYQESQEKRNPEPAARPPPPAARPPPPAARRRGFAGATCDARRCELDDFDESLVDLHYAGRRNHTCDHCGALHWKCEANARGVYTACCNGGKVRVPDIREPPPYLKDLYLGTTKEGKEFLDSTRWYNNACAFASQKVDDQTVKVNHQPCPIASMRICGAPHAYHGPLEAPEGSIPRNGQLYLLDADAQNHHRSAAARVKPKVVARAANGFRSVGKLARISIPRRS